MRIAFISYEYEGVVSGGGIGTYVRHAAKMLNERGHDVSVFTNGNIVGRRKGTGGTVYTVASTHENFSSTVLPIFSACHAATPFDVIETAEYGADAANVFARYPNIARVVKLHTPSFIISDINFSYVSSMRKARFILGETRRGRWPKPFWVYDPEGDQERLCTLSADVVTVPSIAIAERVQPIWNLRSSSIIHVANVFTPSPALLRVSPDTRTQRVTFVGKLEPRKGVIELARAIPIVLRDRPNTKIRIVGRSLQHPDNGEELKQYMQRVLGRHVVQVEFIEGVPSDEIPRLLEETDICVFPSVWENFPYVCLEAMAAARGVIGSSAGGMAEIIEHGRTGLVVPPRDHKAIAKAIVKLLDNHRLRIGLGSNARDRVLRTYGPGVVAPLQEASYARAIEAARQRVYLNV